MDVIIKSRILSQFPKIVHGMSTKLGGNPNPPYYNNLSKFTGDDEISVLQNREKFYSSLGITAASIASANQIHSANVTAVNKPGLYKESDALITNTQGLNLLVSVADCLPVLIYDKAKSVIACIHSGWRGTQKGIVPSALEKMKSEFGSDPRDMKVYTGPCISREHVEVGGEVAELFEGKYVYPHPQPFSQRERGASAHEEKFFIDLRQVVTDQLLSCGVKKENIERTGLCTFGEKDYLHSYRRDRDKSGRMFALIGIKKAPH